MPLTSPCDGDVLARCNVDKQVAPYLMGGYIQVGLCVVMGSRQVEWSCRVPR